MFLTRIRYFIAQKRVLEFIGNKLKHWSDFRDDYTRFVRRDENFSVLPFFSIGRKFFAKLGGDIFTQLKHEKKRLLSKTRVQIVGTLFTAFFTHLQEVRINAEYTLSNGQIYIYTRPQKETMQSLV